MTKRPWRPREETLALILEARRIIAEAEESGYRFTLRRVYYALVSENRIANTERQYKRLSAILDRARWEGFIAMDALEDRGRVAVRARTWPSPEEAVRAAARSYRSDWWARCAAPRRAGRTRSLYRIDCHGA